MLARMTELLTIGQVADRTGLTVHTIRFWSDSGLLPPSGRSAGGYRLYDGAAVARLELIRTLRDLGLGLEAVREVLQRRSTITEVAGAHVRALDAEIRLLRVRRAVLTSVAHSGDEVEQTRLIDRLARVSAAERQRLIDTFVDELAASVHADDPARAENFKRWLPAELPADPTPEQVDAWVELAELVAVPGFRRAMQTTDTIGPLIDHGPVLQPRVRDAVDGGTDPASPQAREIVAEIVGDLPRSRWPQLADQVAGYSDARAERYWALLMTLNGHAAQPPAAPLFDWFAAALRAHATKADGRPQPHRAV